MIHVYMRGRLGNQLFQYAFVRMLQFNNPEAEVCWHWNDVISQGKEEEGWKNSLVDFNTIGTLSQAIEPKLNLLQKLIYRIYWMFYPHNADIEVRNKYQLRWAPILNKCALYYLDLGFFSFKKLLKNKCDVLISGNFESSRFFYEIDNQIRKEIIPRYPVMDHNIEMMDLIRTTNSVCVSIRRGDYINNNETEKLLNICGKSYYDRAVLFIKEHVESPVLFFFSDDIEWVKTNLSYDLPCYYEKGDDPQWEKLRLMFSCHHFIIPNSTFAWWAQHLCSYPDKLVLAPSRWYNSRFVSALYENHWVKISVE